MICSAVRRSVPFQFTTSQGGRQAISLNAPYVVDLSIHDLTRRSTSSPRSWLSPLLFQFTTSQGGRPNISSRSAWNYVFQFTTSQGGRHRDLAVFISPDPFNSRPHKEVDCTADATEYSRNLSIHDLTRRSTCITLYPSEMTGAFQFTTSQGGRLKDRH